MVSREIYLPALGGPPAPPKSIRIRYEHILKMLELLREGSAPNDNPWVEEHWKTRVRFLLAEIDAT